MLLDCEIIATRNNPRLRYTHFYAATNPVRSSNFENESTNQTTNTVVSNLVMATRH